VHISCERGLHGDSSLALLQGMAYYKTKIVQPTQNRTAEGRTGIDLPRQYPRAWKRFM
jgi:hypothetical protein